MRHGGTKARRIVDIPPRLRASAVYLFEPGQLGQLSAHSAKSYKIVVRTQHSLAFLETQSHP